VSLRSYYIERDGADRLLFLLHGWSSEQHHLAAYVPLVDPDHHFTAICPRAPLDMPTGDGASWYDRVDSEPVAESFLEALDLVEQLVIDKSESYGIPLERCVIGGFSQGGFLALAAALSVGAPRFGGVWAMCCGLPEVDGLELDLSPGSGDGRPALIQVGELDPIMPPERGRTITTALRGAGWTVTEAGYPMAHTQRIEMMSDAKSWLTP
jgi:phospholipase/carboxylesterase